MEVTNINQLDFVNGLYTYADYFLWKIEERILYLCPDSTHRASSLIAYQGVSFF